jgi:large subunit ribosomal protein L19
MNPYINTLETAQMEGKVIPEFRTGDTLAVQLRVRDTVGEGNKKTTRERLQPFTGVVLGRKNKGLNSSVTLHRVVDGESITLVLPLYSPLLANIAITRRGDVRSAKIYYLSDLRGKAARIKERYIKKIKKQSLPEEILSIEATTASTEDTIALEAHAENIVTNEETETIE